MLPRAQAVSTLAAEPFDVLVVGGGITGAGVALDASTRGYSVALVEREDYAIGTSSRSSKLVHGGLRYLQNFDLGLVREALLERQLNVALAPHLVRPLPLVVPAFDGARPDRLTGIGLNMYDVMSVDKISPLARRRARDDADWSPARHRVIGGDEVLELVPALVGRSPSGGYLFYDCQTDDVRLVLTVLAEAARFGAVAANRLEAIELLQDGGRACGARVRDHESGDELEIRADNVVNATGVWADRLRPGELHDEAEVPVIRPSRGTHIIMPGATLPLVAGVIAPAGGGRTIFVLLARPDAHRHHGQRLRGRPRARAPAAEDVTTCSMRVNASSRPPQRRHRGRVRGRAAADLHRHPRKSVTSRARRAVRDVERHRHHHRRQADHVAADGEDDRRPDRRARRARRAVPDPPGAARDGGRGGRPAARAGRAGGRLRPARPPLRLRRARGAAPRRRAARARRARAAGDARPAGRGGLRGAPRAGAHGRRRAAAAHPARATAAREVCAPGAAAPRLVADVLAAELGWEPGRAAREVDAFAVEAASEGVVVGAGG